MLKKYLMKIKESFNLLRLNPLYIIVPVLIDLIFLLLVGVTGSYILSPAIPVLERFAALNTQTISIDSLSSSSDMSSFLAESAEKTLLSNQVLTIFAKFILVALVIWIIFQGFNWFLAAKCVKGKVNAKSFFLNFSIASLLWLVLTIVGSILFFRVMLNNLLNQSNIMNNLIANMVSIILVILLLYFSILSYSIASRYSLKEFLKNVSVLGIKDFKKIVMAYAFLIVWFFIANYLMSLISNTLVFFIYGIVIILPLIAFSRTYLTKNMEK